jgi:lipopolysaccharide export system protein LptA
MRDRVARLRFWLAVSGMLLLAVIAGFIGYGRYISHVRHFKLPLPPGVNVVREGGGWTYSRANGSRTLYTIHAAGFQQGKNGKTALHEVSVLLFGKNGDRHDRLSGQDFEYDEKDGVLRAMGQVHIDLQSAMGAKAVGQDAQASTVEGPSGEESLEPDVIHVTTSGLVYLEKLGLAATSEDVDIQAGQMKGHARGADYSSDSGMLMLHSAVALSGVSGGHEVHITAAQAQFEQPTQVARLTNATYASDGRSIAAEHAVLHRRRDGTLAAVDAQGSVTLSDHEAKAVARTAELKMDAAGQPVAAQLSGGINYFGNQPLRQVSARANEARVGFAGGGRRAADHAVFTGAVHIVERIRPDKALDTWSSREVTAEKLETWMMPGPAGAMQLETAEATGQAKLVSMAAAGGMRSAGSDRTEIAADELKAAMSHNRSATALDHLTGRGHTVLTQVTRTGVQQTSSGDTLDARFAAASPRSGARMNRSSMDAAASGGVSSAVQQGHVAILRRIPPHLDAGKKQVAEELQHAVADRAAYDGAKDQLTLAGAVRMSDAASTMWARQVALDRATGDAHALGSVKVDYVGQPGSPKQAGDPMHIMAERADVDGASSSATFYGSPVRVWQSGNQIQAPEVQLERDAKRLTARGSGNAAANSATVRTILVSGAEGGGSGQQGGGSAEPRCGVGKPLAADAGRAQQAGSSVVRIASGRLVYSGVTHQVEFTGGVRADTADASVRAAQAIAFLSGNRSGQSGPPQSLDGGLNTVVASGEVYLARRGTHASGEKLVYEAATRIFVLSGSGSEPAKATDARGTTTAAAFRFNTCDDTLDALGDAPGGATQRVDTDAVAGGVKQREKLGR